MKDESEQSNPSTGSIASRLPVWGLALCCGAFLVGSAAVDNSRLIVERGWDRSALAWTGFLPFMVPFFFLSAAKVVGPVAVAYELAVRLLTKGR